MHLEGVKESFETQIINFCKIDQIVVKWNENKVNTELNVKRLSQKFSFKVPQKASAIACKVVEHLVVFHGGAALFQL